MDILAGTDLITVEQAAAILRIKPHSVRYLIRAERLRAETINGKGRQYLIRRADLDRINYGKPGRPKSKKGK